MHLRLQSFDPASGLREGVDVVLVARALQVRFTGPNQHGWQASTQVRQRLLQRHPLRCCIQWNIAVALGPYVMVMRLTFKTVKSEDLILLVIRGTEYMNTNILIILETAVLDPQPEHTGRNISRLCWVYDDCMMSPSQVWHTHTLVVVSGPVVFQITRLSASMASSWSVSPNSPQKMS